MDQNDESDSEYNIEMEVNSSYLYTQVVAPPEEVPPGPPADDHSVELDSAASSSTRTPSPSADRALDAHSSKKRSHSADEADDDDGALCPICLDNWTNTGEHRICALKCGHLFGYKCVTRWLNSQTKKTCPTCKKRVVRTDIRNIYAKRLVAVDATEFEALRAKLDVAVEDRNRAQNELAKWAYREYALNVEIAQLKLQLTNRLASQAPPAFRPTPAVRLYMEKSMEACKFGGSRVFDAKCQLDLLMYSLKSPNSLFSGFGLKKVSISTYRPTAFIPTHTLQIRDISFHPDNNWVLTASMDKTFKVIDNVSNQISYQFMHQMPLWSCTWDAINANILYVGTQSGTVIKYDIRSLAEPITSLSIDGDMSPVVSVASIPSAPGDCLPLGGVVSCKLNSLWLYENANGDYRRHSIGLEGPFVSMKYQSATRQLLVSSRPNARINYSRHTLCTLEQREPEKIDSRILYSYQGGGMQRLLSKSCFLTNSSDDYVAAHQENCRSVVLWSINTGEKVCSIPAHESVLDLKGLQNQNGNFLVSLTEKKLEFFKFL